MKPSVYIETSILSALVDERDDPVSRVQRQVSLEWWSNQKPHFDLYSSLAVETELAQMAFPRQDEALEFLDELNLLPITQEIRGVARTYQAHLLMPREEMGDAVHLAVASVHGLDYLRTWNCSHLANTNKVQHIRVINRRLALFTPEILTPLTLVAEEET